MCKLTDTTRLRRKTLEDERIHEDLYFQFINFFQQFANVCVVASCPEGTALWSDLLLVISFFLCSSFDRTTETTLLVLVNVPCSPNPPGLLNVLVFILNPTSCGLK